MKATLPASPSGASDLRACVSYFTSLDQNRNGVRDWMVVEGTSGEVLAPLDEDIDGDGLTNVLDPDPFVTSASKKPFTRAEVPEHLAMEGERGRVQREIYEKVGVLAVDHTDRHSLGVLEAFRDVAVRALSPGFEKKAPSLKYLYAFKGHDPRSDIAAYHREMKAISIGGISSWSEGPRSTEDRVRVLAALAHETGHAFLFDKMTPEELARTGSRFGNWSATPVAHFHDEKLLKKAHPFRKLAGLLRGSRHEAHVFMSRSVWVESNIVSRYSTTNMHEWFADAFAADVLQRLGERGLIPASDGDWKKSLALAPNGREWWANYNNVTPGFRLWMKSKLDSSARASVLTREPASP